MFHQRLMRLFTIKSATMVYPAINGRFVMGLGKKTRSKPLFSLISLSKERANLLSFGLSLRVSSTAGLLQGNLQYHAVDWSSRESLVGSFCVASISRGC